MLKPFEASEIKISRAKQHLQELTTEIDAFLNRDAVQVVVEIPEEFKISNVDMRAYPYREKESIPAAWAAIIGDIIHNLRASFDLLACDLHRMTGGNEKDISHVYYPFCKDKREIDSTIFKIK